MLHNVIGPVAVLTMSFVFSRPCQAQMDMNKHVPGGTRVGQECRANLRVGILWPQIGECKVTEFGKSVLKCDGKVDFPGQKGDFVFRIAQNAKDHGKVDYEFKVPGQRKTGTKPYAVNGDTLTIPGENGEANIHVRPFGGDPKGIEIEVEGVLKVHLECK
jgi:hypothetical protein